MTIPLVTTSLWSEKLKLCEGVLRFGERGAWCKKRKSKYESWRSRLVLSKGMPPHWETRPQKEGARQMQETRNKGFWGLTASRRKITRWIDTEDFNQEVGPTEPSAAEGTSKVLVRNSHYMRDYDQLTDAQIYCIYLKSRIELNHSPLDDYTPDYQEAKTQTYLFESSAPSFPIRSQTKTLSTKSSSRLRDINALWISWTIFVEMGMGRLPRAPSKKHSGLEVEWAKWAVICWRSVGRWNHWDERASKGVWFD